MSPQQLLDPRSWDLPAEETISRDSVVFLALQLFFPLLEGVPAARADLQLVKILLGLL